MADPLQFMMRGLFNTSSTFMGVASQQDTYQKGEAAVEIAKESVRTLMGLPTLLEMPQEAKDALPDSLKPLVAQYQTLMETLRARIQERHT